MTNEEIVIEIQAGGAELLPELWEGCRRFIWKQAYKWARTWAPNESYEAVNSLQEDLYQTGYLAVEEAARRYKPDKEALFLTFLGFYLKKHFMHTTAEFFGWNYSAFTEELKNLKKARNAGIEKRNLLNVDSLNRPILNEGSDDVIELGDQIADPTDFVEKYTERAFLDSLHNELEHLLNQLDPGKSEAIRLVYYKSKTYGQVAQIQNITPDAVRWRISTGLRDLRRINMREKRLEAYIDVHTSFYRHVGVKAFQNTSTSSVELIFLQREELREACDGKL